MLQIFYILVCQQILQGLYSLWNGFAWLGMVRRRLATHAGFYNPKVALICPCKGADPGLEATLMCLTHFDYPNYEIFFAVASVNDPAMKAIERIKTSTQRKINVVIAGPPLDRGEKVNNLSKVIDQLNEAFEVIVFTDADTLPSRGWLIKLITPLGDPRIGAATTYRWLLPMRAPKKSALASALGSVWNASIATMLGDHAQNFCWGGGTAIRRMTFLEIGADNFWRGAVADDLALTNAVRGAGMPIVFVPECITPTPYAATFSELVEFTNRQIILTRVYSPKIWLSGAIAHFSYVITFLTALAITFSKFVSGDPWISLAVFTLLIPLLAAMKGALRTIAITELLPEWKVKMHEWSWSWTALAPVVPFLFFWNFCVSLATRQIRWRGLRYRLVSMNQTDILRP
jgi:cellulose synthase/poly-beta-1,6-N-acetylglucosamine synthase-like glycosyltransferase